jgi:hypothetical protein
MSNTEHSRDQLSSGRREQHLARFLRTPEGSTVTQEELEALIPMERAFRSMLRQHHGRAPKRSVLLWHMALAQTRMLKGFGEELESPATEAVLSATVFIRTAANDVALNALHASRMRSAEARSKLVAVARAALVAMQARLDETTSALRDVEERTPSMARVHGSA